VAARHDTQAALLDRGIVEMNDHRDHRMVLVREVGIVLVHRKRRAVLRRLDEHLRMMQLDVRTDDAPSDAHQSWIDE
jgi:hypothetical protein